MKNNLQHTTKATKLMLSFVAIFATLPLASSQTASAQELDLSQARQMGHSGVSGSSTARRDKGMPVSVEMEALIVDLMEQNIDGNFCTIYKDQGVQVSDESVRNWVDQVTFDATGIRETNVQKKKDNAGNEYLDVEVSYSKEWDDRHNRVVGYGQAYKHVIFAYLELDPEEVTVSQRDRLSSCVAEVTNATAAGDGLNSQFQQQQFVSRAGMYGQMNQLGMPNDRTGQIINPHMISGGASGGGMLAAPRDPMGEIRNGILGSVFGGQKNTHMSADECAALRASMGEDACDPDKGATDAVQEIRNRPGQLLNQGVNMWGNFWNGLFDFAK